MIETLNTPIADIIPELQRVEAIRRRLCISILAWAPLLGFTRTHYSAMVYGHRPAHRHQSMLALAEKIYGKYRSLQGHGMGQEDTMDALVGEFCQKGTVSG